jgi:hypothetical protein
LSNDQPEQSSDESSDTDRSKNKALQVSGAALVEFLNRVAPDNKCSFCSVGEYTIIPSPSDEGFAGVVATPVPNVQRLGVWFFFASCKNCGHSVFFNAPFVLQAMAKDE